MENNENKPSFVVVRTTDNVRVSGVRHVNENEARKEIDRLTESVRLPEGADHGYAVKQILLG